MTIATVTGWTYLAAAALASGAGASALTSDSRRRDLVAWRAATVRLLRRHGWSLPRIGRLMRRHHTSMLAALARKPQPLESEITLCMEEIERHLTSPHLVMRPRLERKPISRVSRVAAFPPGGDKLIMAGLPPSAIEKLHPSWAGFRRTA